MYGPNGKDPPAHGIAVVGMAGRFPGAGGIEEYWQNLCAGVESISFFSDEELIESGVPPSDLENPRYVRAAGVVDGIELFDARFFGYNPFEAAVTDPQQRLLLECSWTAMEHAGYAPDSCRVPVGVYMGADLSTYLLNNLLPLLGRGGESNALQIVLSNSSDSVATRVSYRMNLTGPSMSVQTACSTSLVAVHVACLALQNYECEMALAGGAFIPVPQKVGYHYEEGGHLSPDGHVRAFDASAGGTVNGSGVAVVVLKRLEDALADGDTIHAVIRGSSVNNDGSQKVGFTAPSVDGQAEVIEAALAAAGVPPDSVTYIETHGTGTKLGDPIEIAALTKAFRDATSRKGFCAIGSVKTNIGHASSAAGTAGLIKACLALRHGVIPPSLHFREPNPEIDFDNGPFYVNTALSGWKCDGPRRAGVSSFGLGGTNAHVILEEPPPAGPPGDSRRRHLFVLSAKTDTALETATSCLTEHIRRNPGLDPGDVSYTLQVGRSAFGHRRMLVGGGLRDAANALDGPDPERVLSACAESGDRPVAFMIPGGGSQYVNMGRDLYDRESLYRTTVDRCSEILARHLGFDIRESLFPRPENEREASERIVRTSVALPSLFVTSYSLATLLIEWGVLPQALLGHSLGEYVAACLAGVMSLEDTLSLVVLRSNLIETLPAGAMIAVSLPENEINPLIGDELSIAAVNAPSSCVVSGPPGAVDALEGVLNGRNVDCRRLRVTAAGHSKLFEPIRGKITEFTRRISLNPPDIPYISNVSGTWITPEEATDPSYWAVHLRKTVRFADGVAALLAEPARILLEIGPGHTLCSLARQHPDLRPGQPVIPTMRHHDERFPDDEFLLSALGRLWLAGTDIDWFRYHAGYRRRRVPLPTYPFERERCWVEPHEPNRNDIAPPARTGGRRDISQWFYIPSWKETMPPRVRGAAGVMSDTTCWIIFEDSGGIGSAIETILAREGHVVVRVSAGDRYSAEADGRFTIEPGCREDYMRLAADLRAADIMPRRIVHLFCHTRTGDGPPREGAFDDYQNKGFYSLLHIGRIVSELAVSEPLRIDIVTNGLFDVTGREETVPAKATITGAALVIPLEYPNVICRLIDFPLAPPGEEDVPYTADRLYAELFNETRDLTVAYRGVKRWVRTFENTPLPDPPDRRVMLRENGVYLITAGLGGVGFELSRFIARRTSCRLICVGRTELPPRAEWEKFCGGTEADAGIRARVEKVMELESLGAEVMTPCADVSDRRRMAEIVTDALRRFGRIDGVIHAAAVKGGGLIDMSTREMVEREFAPKIGGACVLDELLGERDVDFFVLTSSINAFAPVPGGAAYAAASSFLDAFARKRDGAGGARWISINWPRWRGVGFAAENRTDARGANGADEEPGMTAQEGVEAFDRILHHSTTPQVIVSPEEIEFYLSANLGLPKDMAARKLGEERAVISTHARPNLATSYVAPRNDTERRIADIWSGLLGIDGVGIHDNFFELGGNSLVATQVLSRIREIFTSNITVRALFEAPTVAGLARKLLEKKLSVVDPVALERMVSEIRQLTDAEIRTAIDEEARDSAVKIRPERENEEDDHE